MFEIDTKELIGLTAALLTTAAFVPQVYKTWKTKEVEAISLTMFIAMFIGVSLWLVYGLFINSLSMVIANAITATLVFTLIFLKIKHHKK
jgi:MtN3 and saliva related transmembrane protein